MWCPFTFKTIESEISYILVSVPRSLCTEHNLPDDSELFQILRVGPRYCVLD